MNRTSLANLKKVATLLVILLSFGFLASTIADQWRIIPPRPLRIDMKSLYLTTLLLCLGYLLNIIAWHFLMRALGASITFVTDSRIWIFSNLTRFLPGKVWQYPSRIYLLSQEGVSVITASVASVEEILLNLSLGTIVALASLHFWKLPYSLERYVPLLLFPAIAPLLLLFFASRKTTNYFVALANKLLPNKKIESVGYVNFSRYWIIPLILVFSARFWIWGIVLFFLANSLVPVDYSLIPMFIGSFSISWLLGYVAPFAPAGLGVTELSLASLLAQYISFPISSLLAIVFRIAVLITEALFSIIALVISRK